jgi:hypothetical protein
MTWQPPVAMNMWQSHKPASRVTFSHFWLCVVVYWLWHILAIIPLRRVWVHKKTARVRRWIRWWWLQQ